MAVQVVHRRAGLGRRCSLQATGNGVAAATLKASLTC